MRLRKIIFLLLLIPTVASSDDCGPFGCFFSPGTVCVNGVCVQPGAPVIPTPAPETPTATSVISLKPSAEVQEIACPATLQDVQIHLALVTPVPAGTEFFTAISQNGVLFYAVKDIIGRFVFVEWPSSKQEVSLTAYAMVWRNYALESFLAGQTCESIKKFTFAMGYGETITTFKFKE